MALTVNRGKTEPLLVTADTAATQVTVGDVTAGHVEQQVVTVKSTGKTVNTPTARYTRTNFYIRQTQQYIPSRKLRVFINFRWFSGIMTTVLGTQFTFLVMVSTILGRTGPIFELSLACFLLSLVTILTLIPTSIVFCQHLHVVCWTIPWVLHQPVIPNMTWGNKHLEIAITNLEGVYLSAYNSGVGLVSQKTGKIKFHVLNSAAVLLIRRTRNLSILFAVMTIVWVIWASLVFGISIGDIVIASKRHN